MTQPSFVPITQSDQVRPSYRLQVPESQKAPRPAEPSTFKKIGESAREVVRGTPGPDQGFALSLAKRFASKLKLVEGEHASDVMLGCALIASRRAGMFGRAPSIYDLEMAFELWGFLDDPLPDLVECRKAMFSALSHDYVAQRKLVDQIPEETLRLTSSPFEKIMERVEEMDRRALLGLLPLEN